MEITQPGRLYLIPTPLAEGNIADALSEGVLGVIRSLEYFIVEELRTARRFLLKAGITRPIDELHMAVFNEHTPVQQSVSLLAPVLSGHSMGLLSEAGVPCVADPGSVVVREAHRLHIRVVPLPGPSSVIQALMASGMNGQSFIFHGYLPADKQKRFMKLKEIDRSLRVADSTHIFIETPYRNRQLLDAILSVCSPGTRLCIAVNLNCEDEFVKTREIRDWKSFLPDFHKKPAIFLLSQ